MALSFDGTDDSLTETISLFGGSSTSYNWSLVAWCRPDDRHEGTIIGADEGSGSNGRFSLFSRNTGRFAARRKGSYIQTPNADYNNSNTAWFHVAGTWQYNLRELYVNGVKEAYEPGNKFGGGEAGTTNISLNPAKATNFYIGRDWTTNKYWNGGIAEAAAYSVALTAEDIASLAAGFSPLLVRPGKLIGYWPLGGGYFPATVNPIGSTSLSVNSSPSAEAHPRIIYPFSSWSFGITPEAEEEEEEEVATVKGFVFESMQMSLTQAGRRRFTIPESPTASTNKGWSMESLQASITQAGSRRYSVADSPTASTNKGWSFESLQAMITQGGARRK